MSATPTSNPRASVSVESLDKKAVNVQATEVFDDVEAQKPSKQPTHRKSANVTESLTKDPKYWRIATITGIVGGITCIAVGESKVIVGGDIGPTNVMTVMGAVIMLVSTIFLIVSMMVTRHNIKMQESKCSFARMFWPRKTQTNESEVCESKTNYIQRVDSLNNDAWTDGRRA